MAEEEVGRDLVRPTTRDRLTTNLSIPESCGLLQPSVDSLLARRPSLWPLTTNRGNDGVVRNGFAKTGVGLSEAATSISTMVAGSDDPATLALARIASEAEIELSQVRTSERQG
jgi:hypothetical protein